MARREPAVFNIAEAKARFAELVRRAGAGEEIVIARDHRPIARLGPVQARRRRAPGTAKGKIRIGPDFDAPIPGLEPYRP